MGAGDEKPCGELRASRPSPALSLPSPVPPQPCPSPALCGAESLLVLPSTRLWVSPSDSGREQLKERTSDRERRRELQLKQLIYLDAGALETPEGLLWECTGF
ncbi:unnamed protein product [Boreogadus saida]